MRSKQKRTCEAVKNCEKMKVRKLPKEKGATS